MTGTVLVRVVVAVGARVGRGHLSRGMALATALSIGGARPQLVTLDGSVTAIEADCLRDAGVQVVPADAASSEAATVTVFDLPDPNAVASLGRPTGSRHVVVFDDLGAFTGSASIVVQPSSMAWVGSGSAARVLAGYAYVPIAQDYRRLAASAPRHSVARDSGIPTVVVCFGGSDPAGVTDRLAPIISSDPRWRTEVVVGPAYGGDRAHLPRGWVRDPANLPPRLAAADVAVLGAGTMKFEAACLGVPAILVAAADDQLSVGPEFAASGAAVWAGDGRTVDPVAVRDLVAALLADPGRLRSLGRRARKVVDGRGAERLATAILELAWHGSPQ